MTVLAHASMRVASIITRNLLTHICRGYQPRVASMKLELTRNPTSQNDDDIQQSLFNDIYVSTIVFGCDAEAHVLVRMRSCLSLARSDTSRHGVLRMSRSLGRCSCSCSLVARCIAIIRSVARCCLRLR